MAAPRFPLGPCAAALFVLAAGVAVCSEELELQAATGLAAGAAAAAAATAGLLSGRRLPLLLAAAALGWSRAPAPVPALERPPRAVELTGRLASCRALEDGTAVGELDRLRRVDGQPLDRAGRRLRFHSPQGLPPAGRLRCAGLLSADGGWLRLERAVWTPLPGHGPGAVQRLRQAIRLRLEARLGPEESAMAIALLLGDRGAIPERRYGPYRGLGLLHLLAVSGMHLWLWDAMLRRSLPARLRWLRLPLLGLTALLAGGRPPVVRALAVVCLRDLAARRGWRVPSLQLWAGALWAELALLPARPAELGLVLSYTATGALIVAAAGPGDGDRRGLRRLLAPLRASTAAFLGSAPWLQAVQGTLEPWSVPLTPVLALLLPLRLGLALLAALPGAGAAVVWPLETLGAAEGAMLRALDTLPATPLPAPRWPSGLLGLLCGASLVLLTARRAGLRAAAGAAAGALSAALLVGVTGPAQPGLVALPVGHGLGVVVAGYRDSVVFDLGSSEHRPRRLVDRILLPELHRRRWPPPRFHLASHQDLDHVSGLGRLRRELGSSEIRAAPGRSRRVPGLEPWTAVAHGSRPAEPSDSNGRGQILELTGPPGRVVLIGDQEGWALRQLLAMLEPGPVDLLLLPHHGLSTDGLAELLDHLQPRQVWISCGRDDLPLPCLPLVQRRGIPWRTTLRGALCFPEAP